MAEVVELLSSVLSSVLPPDLTSALRTEGLPPVKPLQICISDEADNGTLSTEPALSFSTRIVVTVHCVLE
jgi:hypothetical protein